MKDVNAKGWIFTKNLSKLCWWYINCPWDKAWVSYLRVPKPANRLLDKNRKSRLGRETIIKTVCNSSLLSQSSSCLCKILLLTFSSDPIKQLLCLLKLTLGLGWCRRWRVVDCFPCCLWPAGHSAPRASHRCAAVSSAAEYTTCPAPTVWLKQYINQKIRFTCLWPTVSSAAD